MRDNFITFVTFLGLIGIPSIFSMFVYVIRTVHKMISSFQTKFDVLMSSQQAQMRAVLVDKYEEYERAGWVSISQLTEWDNQYQQYHLLGGNGIMDAKRHDLLQLPNVPPTGTN